VLLQVLLITFVLGRASIGRIGRSSRAYVQPIYPFRLWSLPYNEQIDLFRNEMAAPRHRNTECTEFGFVGRGSTGI
jgi:hypothetical protein